MNPPAKKILDPVQVFEAFVAFSGNIVRVSVATDTDIETIDRLAKEGQWHTRIKQLDELGMNNREETQRALNNGVNYIQATRLRSLIDRLIRHLGECSTEELMAKLTTEKGEWKTRSVTDLVKAAEAVQLMTQRALGQNPASDSNGKNKTSSIALSVMAALNASTDLGLDSVEVVKQQLAPPHD